VRRPLSYSLPRRERRGGARTPVLPAFARSTKAVEKITSYRYWPLFLPDAPRLAQEIYHELSFMLENVTERTISQAFSRLAVKVDAAELAHYVREKKATRREARDRAVDNV